MGSKYGNVHGRCYVQGKNSSLIYSLARYPSYIATYARYNNRGISLFLSFILAKMLVELLFTLC